MAISAMQEAFAQSYCANGGDAADAARQAGYSTHTAKQQAYVLIRTPAIRDRINELLDERKPQFAPLVLKGLAELAAKAESENVRRQALADLGKMCGLGDTRIDVNIKREESLEEVQERIKATLEELGGDASNIVQLFEKRA